MAWAVALGAQTAIYSEAPFHSAQGERGPGVPALWVRPGYRVELVAENVGEARFMAFDDTGRLYLSRPGRGDILVFQRQADATYKQQATFVDKLPTVQGMCWEGGWMWFAQTGAIYRGRDTNGDGKADEVVAVIPEGKLPKGGGHFWRSLLVTRDAIFTSIGDTGNITDETNSERQKIFRFNKDGTGKKLWASGLRNTEKLRLRPGTQEIWGSDHGSDNFGIRLGEEDTDAVTDFNPPDELNHYVEGAFYGHPFITGLRMPRPEFSDRPDLMALAAKRPRPPGALARTGRRTRLSFWKRRGRFPRTTRATRWRPVAGRGTGARRAGIAWSGCCSTR